MNLYIDASYNAEGKEETFLIAATSLIKGKSVCTFVLELDDVITFKD